MFNKEYTDKIISEYKTLSKSIINVDVSKSSKINILKQIYLLHRGYLHPHDHENRKKILNFYKRIKKTI